MITSADIQLEPKKIGSSCSKFSVLNNGKVHSHLYKIWVHADCVTKVTNTVTEAAANLNVEFVAFVNYTKWYTSSDDLVMHLVNTCPETIIRVYVPDTPATADWIQHNITTISRKKIWYNTYDARFSTRRVGIRAHRHGEWRMLKKLAVDELESYVTAHKHHGTTMFFKKTDVLTLISMVQLHHGIDISRYITVIDK